MRPIYWGKLHTETPDDMRRMRLKGEIPEVPETYRYFNVAYPAMNEKGLAIGETTIGGRRELRNDEGLFLIENLQAIALERTTTARDAIKLIGELVEEYGYGDSGECLTFADSKEVWHFEIMGAGPFEVGGVWAAVRIPEGQVGVSANIPRISTLNLDDPDHYMASDNVHSLAEEMGWWDPASGKEFKWWEAYSGRQPYSTREFFILSTLAPSLGLTMEMEELPFSVVPDEKVSVQRVLAYYRETYEGTEFDVTKNMMIPNRYAQNPGDPEMVKSPMVDPWSLGREWGHAHERAGAGERRGPADHRRPAMLLLPGHSGPGLAAARDRDRGLLLLRQPGSEPTDAHLRRDPEPARELQDRLPEELPGRLGLLVVSGGPTACPRSNGAGPGSTWNRPSWTSRSRCSWSSPSSSRRPWSS